VSRIVVGVDGSAGSDAALSWAVAEAALRGSRLRVVHAYQAQSAPVMEVGLGAPAGIAGAAMLAEEGERVRQAAEEHARAVIDGALRRASDDLGGIEIERVAAEGPVTQTLIESARDAELLVVGSRGRGGFLGLLLGSVSQQVALHPPCPVVILPPPEEGAAE
jgi:nucleotide-binding universal stress UspA family protein